MGPITRPPGLPKREVIGFARGVDFLSKGFKFIVQSIQEKNVLVALVITSKLINGSPFNSISVVPVNAP